MATRVPESDLRSFRVVLTTGQERDIPSAYLAEETGLGYTFRDAEHKIAAVFPASYVYEVLSLQAGIHANHWDETEVSVLAEKVMRADKASRRMDKAHAQGLDEHAAYAISIIQGAAETFRRAHPHVTGWRS